MQDQFQKVNKWFKKNFSTSFSYERRGIKPAKDWGTMLALTSVLLCFVLAGSVYIYLGIQNNSLFPEVSVEVRQDVVVDNKLLQKAISRIEAKKESNNIFEKKVPTDPSL